jgi:hypothetical protein
MKKKIITNTVVKAVKGSKKGSDKVIEVTAVTAPAPVVEIPAPAPVVDPAPAPAPAGIQMGVPNLTSRRINPRAIVRAWRIAPNQRKDVFSAGAKYYVQGGEEMMDPISGRSRFEVAIEIPFVDHYLAKLEFVARKATLPASGTEVTKVA